MFEDDTQTFMFIPIEYWGIAVAVVAPFHLIGVADWVLLQLGLQ